MTGIPEYSNDGLAARDVFFASLASVHIFVEDDDLENVYETLIARLFPRLEGFEIFPLAGKDNVIRHARENASAAKTPVRIYLLDKDFDDLLNRILIIDGVFYFDDFNVEAAVIDDASLLRLCVEERPRVRRIDIENRLRIAEAWRDWGPILDRLHRAFALVQRYQLGVPNTDLSPERFTKNGDPSTFDSTKVDHYVEDVARRLVGAGVIEEVAEYAELSRKIFGSARISMKHVNGKFVARLFFHRMKRRRLIGNVTQDSLLMRCVGSSELKRLRGLKRRVSRHLKANNVLS